MRLNYWIIILAFGGVCHAARAVADTTYERLFYTVEQRKMLDASRVDPARTQSVSKPSTVSEKQATIHPLTKPVTLQGFVKRSDGKSTVWVNRQPLQENTILNEMQIGNLSRHSEIQKGRKSATQTDKLNIRISTNGQRIQLKAGQQYNPENNQIKEVTTVAKEKLLLLSESEDEATEIE